MIGKLIDITGRKFGRLFVVKATNKHTKEGFLWECLCDCGNTIEVNYGRLSSGNTSSCGCLRKELMSTHHLSYTPLYGKWADMKQRCLNTKHKLYPLYGGRGITICDEWMDAKSFCKWGLESGYQIGLSIDRIDVNGNYSSENCRLVDSAVQGNNRRDNRYFYYNGETLTLSQICRKYNVNYPTLSSRINRFHWDINSAVETPCDTDKRPQLKSDSADYGDK